MEKEKIPFGKLEIRIRYHTDDFFNLGFFSLYLFLESSIY